MAGLAGLACLALSAGASAQSAPIAIESRKPTLEKQTDGGWTTSVALTNLTEAPVGLIATPTSATAGCELTLDPQSIPRAEHVSVKVAVPAGCDVAKNAFSFTVSPAPGETAFKPLIVSAAEKPTPAKPEWDALAAFPVALLLLSVLTVGFFLSWRMRHKVAVDYPEVPTPGKPPPATRPVRSNDPLKYLASTWSFKDSWVSNVTVAAALLTGIFGSSDVATAFLGTEAKGSVALATVGAAAAAAFIGAGGVMLYATKSKEPDPRDGVEEHYKAGEEGNFFTVGGLLAASVLTLTGAFGQIWTVYRSGAKLPLGGYQDGIVLLAIGAMLLLGVYAARSIPVMLNQGLRKPAPAPSDAVAAAKLIVAALHPEPDADRDRLMGAIEELKRDDPIVAAVGQDAYQPPRRSALL